jgi:hypothetical protein
MPALPEQRWTQRSTESSRVIDVADVPNGAIATLPAATLDQWINGMDEQSEEGM